MQLGELSYLPRMAGSVGASISAAGYAFLDKITALNSSRNYENTFWQSAH